MLALVFSLGGGAYAATQVATQHSGLSAAATTATSTLVSWHTLTLLNGWQSANRTPDV